MAQFIVRNLEDDIQQKLRELASSHGQNMEEFVREVLRRVALERDPVTLNLGTRIAERFSKIGLDAPIEKLHGQVVAPLNFEQ